MRGSAPLWWACVLAHCLLAQPAHTHVIEGPDVVVQLRVIRKIGVGFEAVVSRSASSGRPRELTVLLEYFRSDGLGATSLSSNQPPLRVQARLVLRANRRSVALRFLPSVSFTFRGSDPHAPPPPSRPRVDARAHQRRARRTRHRDDALAAPSATARRVHGARVGVGDGGDRAGGRDNRARLAGRRAADEWLERVRAVRRGPHEIRPW